MSEQHLSPWIPDILQEFHWTLSDSLISDSSHEAMMAREAYSFRLTAILSQQYYSHWDDLRWDYWKSVWKGVSLNDDENDIERLERYAKNGVVEAMLELWYHYYFMDRKEDSKNWLELAGTHGMAGAYIELSHYARQSWEEGEIFINYMQKAANLWDVTAMRHMADFYSERFWHKPDLEQYTYWKNMAIQHGSERAKTLQP